MFDARSIAFVASSGTLQAHMGLSDDMNSFLTKRWMLNPEVRHHQRGMVRFYRRDRLVRKIGLRVDKVFTVPGEM